MKYLTRLVSLRCLIYYYAPPSFPPAIPPSLRLFSRLICRLCCLSLPSFSSPFICCAVSAEAPCHPAAGYTGYQLPSDPRCSPFTSAVLRYSCLRSVCSFSLLLLLLRCDFSTDYHLKFFLTSAPPNEHHLRQCIFFGEDSIILLRPPTFCLHLSVSPSYYLRVTPSPLHMTRPYIH